MKDFRKRAEEEYVLRAMATELEEWDLDQEYVPSLEEYDISQALTASLVDVLMDMEPLTAGNSSL
jgi:hypothetical protein